MEGLSETSYSTPEYTPGPEDPVPEYTPGPEDPVSDYTPGPEDPIPEYTPGPEDPVPEYTPGPEVAHTTFITNNLNLPEPDIRTLLIGMRTEIATLRNEVTNLHLQLELNEVSFASKL